VPLHAFWRESETQVVGTLPRVSRPRTRWEEDNVAPINVAAFVAIAVIVLVIAGLAILLAVT
jgi:hypothetical protein